MRDVPVCLAVTRFKIEFVLPLPACQHYLITSVCEAIQLEDNNSGSTFAVVYSLCVSDTLYGLCIIILKPIPSFLCGYRCADSERSVEKQDLFRLADRHEPARMGAPKVCAYEAKHL